MPRVSTHTETDAEVKLFLGDFGSSVSARLIRLDASWNMSFQEWKPGQAKLPEIEESMGRDTVCKLELTCRPEVYKAILARLELMSEHNMSPQEFEKEFQQCPAPQDVAAHGDRRRIP